MEKPAPHEALLARVAERLASTGTATDQLLLAGWRVVGLAQYLLGAPDGTAEKLCVEVLDCFAREGAGSLKDKALKCAGSAVARATTAKTGSVLPVIAPEVRAEVLSRLQEYQELGTASVQKALDLLPALRRRLRQPPAGAILAGIRYRLELVASLMADTSRSDEERQRAVAAILYLHELHDAIPDSLGHIGLLDDDFGLRVVLDQIGEHTDDEKLHWAERISALWDDLPFLRGVRLCYEQGPVATTWLDRINSYVSYSYALGGAEMPLVLIQPSVACSPLHAIVSLIGLLVLDRLTSSRDLVSSLREGQVYEIDGKYYVEYEGVLSGAPAPGWLRLRLHDITDYRPPTFSNRMVAVPDRTLSSAKEFAALVGSDDAEPIQRFFGWEEAIGAASVASRVLLVTSRQRAIELFGGVRSNGVSLLDNGLIRFAGQTPGTDGVRTGLVLVVPTLRVARDLVERGVDAHVVVIDGYERLHRGRHDLPFLLTRASPPKVIAWSPTGYYPEDPPSWLPQHRLLKVAPDDLSSILELDGDMEDAIASSRASLWEAATGAGLQKVLVPSTSDEVKVLTGIDDFLHLVRSAADLPDYWKYQLCSSAITLRTLVTATAAYWCDIHEFADSWDVTFRERWKELRARVADRLAPVADGHRMVVASVAATSAERNSKAEGLLSFLQGRENEDWRIVCDRPEQATLVGRFARRFEYLQSQPVLMRDLGVCHACIVLGWRSASFGRRLRAHTPRRLVALVDDSEAKRWDRLETQSQELRGESILAAVGYRTAVAPEQSKAANIEPPDDDLVLTYGGKLSVENERLVRCVFMWLADEPECKVLERGSHVLVEEGDRAREKPAYRIVPDDRVILGPGSSRWSPADEFTEAVVRGLQSSKPELARDAREWRKALRRLQENHSWTSEELQRRLAETGIQRELQTLNGWLRVDQAAPIGPRHIRQELRAMWPLIGGQTERTVDEVADACAKLRSLRSAAGRSLLKLWKGESVHVGVEERWLEELLGRLRHEVQVHVVDSISYGIIPEAMLGWWITSELVESFEAGPPAPADEALESEAGEDD